MLSKMFSLFAMNVMLLIGTTTAVTNEAANEKWYIVILTSVLGIMLLVVGYFLAQFISNVNKSKIAQDLRMSKVELDQAVHKEIVESLAKTVSKDIAEMGKKLNSNKELKDNIIAQMNRIEGKIR